MIKSISRVHKIKKENFNQVTAILVIIIIALVGVHYLIGSHAATPYSSVNASQGQLSNGASKVVDPSASNGYSVKFAPIPFNQETYTTKNNQILDANGQQVILHGVNRPSLQWDCAGTDVYNDPGSGIPASDFVTMRTKWNVNAVRINLNQDFWLKGSAIYCPAYAANINSAVQAALANKMIVILDLHLSDQGDLQNPKPARQCMPDQNSITFWQQFAPVYKNNPNIWYELYNEPDPPTNRWAIWKNGGQITCAAESIKNAPPVTYTAVGMQTLYNTVRAAGANNIVLAGGIFNASDFEGAPNPPINGTNLGYAVHLYASKTNPNSFNTSNWDLRYGNFSKTAPIVATELGDWSCGAEKYDQTLFGYLRSHNISLTPWAYFVGNCDFPSLITDSAGDCTVAYGCNVQTDLKSYP